MHLEKLWQQHQSQVLLWSQISTSCEGYFQFTTGKLLLMPLFFFSNWGQNPLFAATGGHKTLLEYHLWSTERMVNCLRGLTVLLPGEWEGRRALRALPLAGEGVAARCMQLKAPWPSMLGPFLFLASVAHRASCRVLRALAWRAAYGNTEAQSWLETASFQKSSYLPSHFDLNACIIPDSFICLC